MAGRMYRAQISLEAKQRRTLAMLARLQKRSLSDVAREAIALGLEVMGQEAEARKRRRLAALKRLTQMREATQRKQGVYAEDLVAEARADREAQMETAWRGS